MEDTLITLLETLKYPVMRQGSLAPDQEYPDTFLTFWNTDETGHAFYDNADATVEHDFRISVFSTDPDTAYSVLASARTLLKTNGWIITDRGFDVESDEITHVGRGCTIAFLEPKNIV